MVTRPWQARCLLCGSQPANSKHDTLATAGLYHLWVSMHALFAYCIVFVLAGVPVGLV